MPMHHDIARALQAHKDASGESYRSIAARAGVPTRSLTAIIEGHAPSVDRAADICGALGLEFYIGPPRTPDAAPGPLGRPEAEPAFAPAEDPDFAAVVAALADEYQANNDRGRRSLIARFWALFPELRGGSGGAGSAAPGAPVGQRAAGAGTPPAVGSAPGRGARVCGGGG